MLSIPSDIASTERCRQSLKPMYGRVVCKDRLSHIALNRRKLRLGAKCWKRAFKDRAHNRSDSRGTSRVIGAPTTLRRHAPHTLGENREQLLLAERLEKP